jgi:hypothetical protein
MATILDEWRPGDPLITVQSNGEQYLIAVNAALAHHWQR